ncbi:MAG: hypothetical protein GY708_16380 [Actinomycetia bacterium]|nr:hypothetical protein [Actinomycetes bacterium]MCP4960811.1 hypothetical protein [Actinomycetes bacterium]
MSSETESKNTANTDWSVQSTDKLVGLIDQVRVQTTGRLLTVARAIVYGIVLIVVAVAALILLIVGMVRLVDVLLPGQVWSAHLLIGVIFCLGGFVLWRKRAP